MEKPITSRQPLKDLEATELAQLINTQRRRARLDVAYASHRSTLAFASAGVAIGFALRWYQWMHVKYQKRVGFTEFPDFLPADILEPFKDEKVIDIPDCTKFSPKPCEEDIECQRLCGPRFRCQDIISETNIEGVILTGGKYCLPYQYAASGCKTGVSNIALTFDPITLTPHYKCHCKFPDIFGGPECLEYYACRDPRNPANQAPLWDYVDDVELDIRVLPVGINLYETYQRNGKTMMRYRCKCKTLSHLYTSAFDPHRCNIDPCFSTRLGRPHPDAVGLEDGEDGTIVDSFVCKCGPPSVTRLYGGINTPCLPIMDAKCARIVNFGTTTQHCVCTPDENGVEQVFIPCKNKYREGINDRYYKLPCGEDGIATAVLPKIAPEAGSCVNACEACARLVRGKGDLEPLWDDPCQDNFRTLATCSVLTQREYQHWYYGEFNPSAGLFDCHCLPRPGAWWDLFSEHDSSKITFRGEQCKGRLRDCVNKGCPGHAWSTGPDAALICCLPLYRCTADARECKTSSLIVRLITYNYNDGWWW